MICKFCDTSIGGGGILKSKQHLVGIRGQVKPREAPNEVSGLVRAEYLSKFEKFEENKAREKAIQDEIARKRELLEAMKESGYDDYEIQDSSSIPSTNDPFHYVPPLCQQSKGTKRTNIQSYFSSSATIASANPTYSQPSHQPIWINIGKNNAKILFINTLLDGGMMQISHLMLLTHLITKLCGTLL